LDASVLFGVQGGVGQVLFQKYDLLEKRFAHGGGGVFEGF
jgi:hypothetical protein